MQGRQSTPARNGEGKMRRHAIALLALVTPLVGCASVRPTIAHVFSFETGLAGWLAQATAPQAWSVDRTRKFAADGHAALALQLDNRDEPASLWIQRAFHVKPNRPYRVTVDYDFASRDFGNLDFWRLITTVAPNPPETPDDLAFPDNTDNGSDTDVGLAWNQKRFNFDVRSDQTGKLYVIIGVGATWQDARTYALDNVRVAITEQAAKRAAKRCRCKTS